MKYPNSLLFYFGSALVFVLLIGCTPSNTPLPKPTLVRSPTSTPTLVSTNLPGITTTSEGISVAPLITAPYIDFGSWSPDGQWLAYWVSSQEDLERSSNFMPGGTLNFRSVISGETCAVSEFATPDNQSAKIYWSESMEAIIIMGGETFAGKPCQTEPYRKLEDFISESTPDLSLSLNGKYRADTVLDSHDNGILTFETTVTDVGSKQPVQHVTWQIDERVGDYGLGGEWISTEQFLLYETLDQGPLILDTERGVIPVLAELFGVAEIPSIGESRGYGLRAIPLPGLERDSFHLLIQGAGGEANFPNMTLYHAENGTVETLPFRHVWGKGHSPDGQWLLIDERPTIGGYETYSISIRRVEDVHGDWQLIANDVDSASWTADWTEMAFNSDATVTWQTFPDAEPIGQWNTGEFWAHPVAWSPDGHALVTIGNIPGVAEYGLFILER